MSKAIHIICHPKGGGYQNLWKLTSDDDVYRSACWAFPATMTLSSLVDGWLFLHDAKDKPSHSGGIIARIEACDRPTAKTDKGFAIYFKKMLFGVGRNWDFALTTENPYEWHSGIVDLGTIADAHRS